MDNSDKKKSVLVCILFPTLGYYTFCLFAVYFPYSPFQSRLLYYWLSIYDLLSLLEVVVLQYDSYTFNIFIFV